jgi:hypothetical protein
MFNNKKTEFFFDDQKDMFPQSNLTLLKKFYLWLTLFVVATGTYLLLANGHIGFGNIFACGVCLIVGITWLADGLKTKPE